MSFQPSSFLETARELHKGVRVSDEQARLRTAASRAFYAAFLATIETVRQAYSKRKVFVTQDALIRGLKQAPEPAVSSIGTRLDALKNFRRSADYDLDWVADRNAVALHIVEADLVISTLPSIKAKIPPGLI